MLCVWCLLYTIVFMTRLSCFFFFNDTATTVIYTLSLHDALPIYACAVDLLHAERHVHVAQRMQRHHGDLELAVDRGHPAQRSEEHTSELQSLAYLVCRLLLEKKNIKINSSINEI